METKSMEISAVNCNSGNGRQRLVIEGHRPLKGVITANGAKNAALPIMAATILAPGELTLCKVPAISDVQVMANLIKFMGARVEYNGDGCVRMDTAGFSEIRAPYDLVKKLNASFDIAGALVSRFGEAHLPLPGGCVIGTRAVDQHLEGFKALGCQVDHEPGGYIKIKANNLVGGRFRFQKTSVGATKNVLMSAVLARGKSILENVAREPEIIDLVNFLNRCGARITGQGTSRLEIQGVKKLDGNGIRYTIIPDRIETATYLLCAPITGGDITVTETEPVFLKAFIRKLYKAGQEVTVGADSIRVVGREPIQPVGAVITEPYPGFPTDLQPQMVSMLALSDGVSYVKEKIFDMRFNYIDELRRMGADVHIDGNTAVVKGVKKLLGAPVEAPDIRAGSALILSALSAEGISEVTGLQYVDRGYEKIEERLAGVGASIRRES